MGKVLSVLSRQINRFNVESRAHRILSKEKPSPAPRHTSTKEYLDQFLSETKHVRDDLLSKHKQLDENLKKVYIVSHDTVPQDRYKPSEKARLPSNRSTVVESELGYEEPENIPDGRITLKQAMQILSNHQGDGKKYDSKYISNEYKLSEEDSVNLLKYFTTFKVHIPEKLVLRRGDPIKAYLKPAVVQQKQEEKEVVVQQNNK